MNVTITLKDLEDNDVEVDYNFDPPLTEETVMTAAGFLAAEFAALVQQHLGDDSDGTDEHRIVVPSSKYIL